MPLFRDSEPDVYGLEFRGIRDKLRKGKGALKCVMCHDAVHINLNQVPASQAGAPGDIHELEAEYQRGALCKECGGVLCPACSSLSCMVTGSPANARCPVCGEPVAPIARILD